jgi:hypothetical protein
MFNLKIIMNVYGEDLFEKSIEILETDGPDDALRFLICDNLIFTLQKWDLFGIDYSKDFLLAFVESTKSLFSEDEIHSFFERGSNFSAFYVSDEISYIVDYIMLIFRSDKSQFPISDPVDDAEMIIRLEFCRELFCTSKWF